MENGLITKYELHPSLLNIIEHKNPLVDKDKDGSFSILGDTITLDKKSKTVPINISKYNQDNDELLVFENGTYMEKGFQYNISNNNIIGINGEFDQGSVFTIICLKNAKINNYVLKSSTLCSKSTNVVAINNENYDKNKDVLIAFTNSLFLSKYSISEDCKFIINNEGEWEQGRSFHFIIFKNMKLNKSIETKTIKLENESNKVETGLNIDNVNDILFVFENGVFINKSYDYQISNNNIISKKDKWDSNTTFDFISIKDILYNSNKIFTSNYKISEITNKFPINISKYNRDDDMIFTFQNSIYIERGENYSVSKDSKIITKDDGNWNKYTNFDVLVLKDIFKDGNGKKSSHILLNDDIKVPINIPFNKNSDSIFVFKNGTYIDSTDYSISDDGTHILKVNLYTKWKKDTKFNFVIIKNALNSGIVSTNTTISTDKTNKIPININKFDREKDTLVLFQNGVYNNNYYVSDDNKYINKSEGNWNELSKSTKFNFIAIRKSIGDTSLDIGKNDPIIDDANLSYKLAARINECEQAVKIIPSLVKRIEELEKQLAQKNN